MSKPKIDLFDRLSYRDIFENLKYSDIFDKTNLDLLDKVDLEPEEKILYSDELKKLIHQEISKIPIGIIVSNIFKKFIDHQERFSDIFRESLNKEIQKTRAEIQNDLSKLKESEEVLSEKMKKKYADLRNSILSGQSLQQMVGGYVLTVEEEDGSPRGQPTRLKFPNGTVTDNNDGTYSVSGISSFVTAYRAITANRTLDSTDHLINCTSGTFTVTLPTAVGIQGREYIIKNSGTGTITLATTSSQTIDDETTQTLLENYCIVVVSDGSNWMII